MNKEEVFLDIDETIHQLQDARKFLLGLPQKVFDLSCSIGVNGYSCDTTIHMDVPDYGTRIEVRKLIEGITPIKDTHCEGNGHHYFTYRVDGTGVELMMSVVGGGSCRIEKVGEKVEPVYKMICEGMQ